MLTLTDTASSKVKELIKAEDNPELHSFDTVKGGDYLADQDAVGVVGIVAAAPQAGAIELHLVGQIQAGGRFGSVP